MGTRCIIEFPTSLIVCCCTTLQNATAYTSSPKKMLELICNACGNFFVVTKQEIMVIFLTDFFDAASRRHSDVILLPAIRRVSGNGFIPAGQCTGTPCRARATVELLRQETPNFFASNLWPSNSPDLSSVDYEWIIVD